MLTVSQDLGFKPHESTFKGVREQTKIIHNCLIFSFGASFLKKMGFENRRFVAHLKLNTNSFLIQTLLSKCGLIS